MEASFHEFCINMAYFITKTIRELYDGLTKKGHQTDPACVVSETKVAALNAIYYNELGPKAYFFVYSEASGHISSQSKTELENNKQRKCFM